VPKFKPHQIHSKSEDRRDLLLRRHGLGFRHRESSLELSLRPGRSAALDAPVLASATAGADQVTLVWNAVSLDFDMHWRTAQAGG
jgi:hypothetical protein